LLDNIKSLIWVRDRPSSAGIKAQNQDFHGIYIPEGHALSSKGIACALADGISSSNVSHIAAETAVRAAFADINSTNMNTDPSTTESTQGVATAYPVELGG
jgi:serine/threonine protein phosphatase PrpC